MNGDIGIPSVENQGDALGSRVTDRFRCPPVVRFPLGGQKELIYFPLTNSAQVFTTSALAVLCACRGFATLDDHAHEIGPLFRMGHGQVDLLKAQLLKFVERGYLVSYCDLLSRCAARARTQQTPAGISSIGWVTRSRLSQLQASLTSYIRNSQHFGRRPDFVVMDATQASGERQRCIQMLRAIQRAYGIRILYAGLEEKIQYAEALTESAGCPLEVVNFALFGTEDCEEAIGANRNGLLLDMAGEVLLGVDDDTLGRTANLGSGNDCDGLRIGAEEPTEFWFFPSRDQALQSVSFFTKDIIGSHESVLGHTLDAIFDRFSRTTDVNLDESCPHLLKSLCAGSGRVLVTFNGVVGDSGMYSSTGLLAAEGGTRERLLRSDADYRCALSSREVLRVVPVTTIYHGATCMAGMIGLDNRDLLPPFQPVLRNSDGVFGASIYKCFHDFYFAHLPFAMIHAAPEGRGYLRDHLSAAKVIRMCDVTMAEVEPCSVGPGKNPEEALRIVGNALIESGSLQVTDFEQKLKMELWTQASNSVSRLVELLKKYPDSPRFWVDDVRKKIDMWQAAVQDPDYIIPSDLAASHPYAERLALTQHLILKFGQLLCWWPALIASAKKLRAQGRRLAQPVDAATTER
jgi:hypothetical protein